MAKCLGDNVLLADADAAAKLFTDELIAADRQLDVMGGGAGAILGLLRLYRDMESAFVLGRAVKCGEHLLAQSRIGPEGRRTWAGQGSGAKGPAHGLNGMSHGAAGFAYALAALAAAAGRDDFAAAAAECIAFETRLTTLHATTGPIYARRSRIGLASGAMARPASGWRGLASKSAAR